MSQMMHIMRKDVRSLRWLLALGLASLVVRVMLVVNGAVAADDSVATGQLLEQMGPRWGGRVAPDRRDRRSTGARRAARRIHAVLADAPV